MPSPVTFTIRDRTDEYTPVTLYIPDLDETLWVASMAAVATIQAAIQAITLGNIARRQVVAESVSVNDVKPTSPYAQRELGVRMFWQETVAPFKKGHITVGCPDLTVIDVTTGDNIDVENVTVMNTLAQAIEAVAVSPDGNPIEFYRAKLVGRNN